MPAHNAMAKHVSEKKVSYNAKVSVQTFIEEKRSILVPALQE